MKMKTININEKNKHEWMNKYEWEKYEWIWMNEDKWEWIWMNEWILIEKMNINEKK